MKGLVDPLETVPHLVALQSDPETAVRTEAMRQVSAVLDAYDRHIDDRI